MFGEVDFAGKFSQDQIIYHGATEVLITFFIIFIGIIIMNFLIGLSIDNMTGLFQAAGVERLSLVVQQVFYLVLRMSYKNNLNCIQMNIWIILDILGYDVGNNFWKTLLPRTKYFNIIWLFIVSNWTSWRWYKQDLYLSKQNKSSVCQE